MGISVDLTWIIDKCVGVYTRRRDIDRGICKGALERIDGERGHFEHIVAKRPFNNSGHEKAATQTSFELLGNAMKTLSQLSRLYIWNWKIRRMAADVARQCEQRDAVEVLALINELKPVLEQQTHGMTGKAADPFQF